jgi:hypothetical protein
MAYYISLSYLDEDDDLRGPRGQAEAKGTYGPGTLRNYKIAKL